MPIVDDGSLRNSLIISTCLHIGMLVFMYFGLPHVFKPLPPLLRPIPIDIVEIGAITNTRIGKEEEAKPIASQSTKPEPPQKTEIKPPEPANKPEVKPTEQKAEKAEDLALLPKPKEKPVPPKQVEAEKRQEQPDQLASVLKNVAKLKPQGAKSDEPKADAKRGAANVTGGAQEGGFGPALSDRLTISQEDALRRQIQQCWNIPAGARNAESLVVEVLIEMNPDRTVREARVVDQNRMATDPFFRAAAESALRALRNPKCTPLELPPDQYEQWKTILFNFDPRDML